VKYDLPGEITVAAELATMQSEDHRRRLLELRK
jgi:hypothetical protein